jgi:hypothetical protein
MVEDNVASCRQGDPMSVSRRLLVLSLLAVLGASAGCRCFPGFDRYADFIDDVGDDECTLEGFYSPRWDISRAGRPDWCGPVNRWFGGCVCCQGTWDRANECWRYPPQHPYWYPGQSVLPPGVTPPQTQAVPPPPSQPQAAPPTTPYEAVPPPAEPNPFEDFPAAPPPTSAQAPLEPVPVFEPPL